MPQPKNRQRCSAGVTLAVGSPGRIVYGESPDPLRGSWEGNIAGIERILGRIFSSNASGSTPLPLQ
jgi:hypothetical protein